VEALERMLPLRLKPMDALVVFAGCLIVIHPRLLAGFRQAQARVALLPRDLLK
jgi:hypothetical protein